MQLTSRHPVTCFPRRERGKQQSRPWRWGDLPRIGTEFESRKSSVTKALVAMLLLISTGFPAQAQPLAAHPALAPSGNGWNIQMGRFGESLVRELHRAKGDVYHDLNVGGHGIDGLVRSVKSDGKVEYRIVEVKTLQNGTDFHLSDTKSGRQLSADWIEDRLATASKHHARAETRKAAAEALDEFRKNRASVRAELHGVSVADNRYIVKSVDSAVGVLKEDIVNGRVTGILEELAKKAQSDNIRQTAVRQLADYDQLQAAAKPRAASGSGFTKQLSEIAALDEKQVSNALIEASEHIRAPGESRWVKVGGKMFKFAGNVLAPAGVVIEASIYSVEAATIEQKVERGELTREQADLEQAKLAVSTATTTGGGLGGLAAGAVIGSFICPGPGTVIGGIVGMVAGCVGAELMMAATGMCDTLGEYLQPGVESVRHACAVLKEKGIKVTLAARDQVREWMGFETYDQSVAVLESAAIWTRSAVVQVATGIKDVAVLAKEKAGEAAIVVRDAASDAAIAVGESAKSGWRFVRRQFE